VGEGQLGHVFGVGDELAGGRVRLDPQRLLDDDSQARVLDHHVDGDQRVPGEVVVGLGDEQGALEDRLFEQRGFDFDLPDLGGFRATLARPRESGLAGQLGF
jgi:hypothetical protein